MTTAPLPILNGFSSYLMDERHFSHYTARCYGADLRQYVEFLAEEGNITIKETNEQSAFDKIDRHALRKNIAIVAVMAYLLADEEQVMKE